MALHLTFHGKLSKQLRRPKNAIWRLKLKRKLKYYRKHDLTIKWLQNETKFTKIG